MSMRFFDLQRRVVTSVSVALLSVCSAATAQAADLTFVGHAYDLEGKALLYIETHDIELDNNRQYLKAQVNYQGPDGKLIAQKTLDYSPEVLRPSLNFEDLRDPLVIRVSSAPERVTLESEDTRGREDAELELDSKDLVIIDAGFDRLVEKYWQRLVQGEEIEFDFLALSRSSLVSFKVYQTSIDQAHVNLAIAPTNWLIGLLMDPIALRYDRQSGRLREYRGVTNIRALENGEISDDNFNALIRYEYMDEMKPPMTAKATGYSSTDKEVGP